MSRRGKNGELTGEDAALWTLVTRTVTRIGVRRSQAAAAPSVDPSVVPARPIAKPSPPLPRAPSSPPRKPVSSVPPQPTALEPRKMRRIVRGRDEIEARIDLHGMRQADAHGALRGFLARAYGQGYRTVLVITGKGRPNATAADAPFDLFQDRDRGVLRRMVPHWLADPDLRSIIVGYTNAHAKHGGDGAFYVQLRNRDRHRG